MKDHDYKVVNTTFDPPTVRSVNIVTHAVSSGLSHSKESDRPSYSTTVKTPENSEDISVSPYKLDRLKEDIDLLPEKTDRRSNVMYAAIGVAVSAVFQLISFGTATDSVATWAWIASFALLLSSIVISLFCFFEQDDVSNLYDKQVTRIKKEIDEIKDLE